MTKQKAKIFVVGAEIKFLEVLALLHNVNLQAAMVAPNSDTVLVVEESAEDTTTSLLKSTFKDAVLIFEAEVFTPSDMGQPGFVHTTLEHQLGVRFAITSGRGLLVSKL